MTSNTDEYGTSVRLSCFCSIWWVDYCRACTGYISGNESCLLSLGMLQVPLQHYHAHLVLSISPLLGERDNTALLTMPWWFKAKSSTPKTTLSYPRNTRLYISTQNVNIKNIISSLKTQYTGRTIKALPVISTQPPELEISARRSYGHQLSEIMLKQVSCTAVAFIILTEY